MSVFLPKVTIPIECRISKLEERVKSFEKDRGVLQREIGALNKTIESLHNDIYRERAMDSERFIDFKISRPSMQDSKIIVKLPIILKDRELEENPICMKIRWGIEPSTRSINMLQIEGVNLNKGTVSSGYYGIPPWATAQLKWLTGRNLSMDISRCEIYQKIAEHNEPRLICNMSECSNQMQDEVNHSSNCIIFFKKSKPRHEWIPLQILI